MSVIKALLNLVPLLLKLVGELIKGKEFLIRRRRHEKIDKAFKKDDPRDSAAELNKFFD